MTNSIIQLMADQGLHPKSIQIDNKIHRFSTKNRNDDAAGWYIFATSNDVVHGSFGCWRSGATHTYCSKSNSVMTAIERNETEAIRKAINAKLEREKKIRQAEAAKRAAAIVDSMVSNVSHEYIQRKQVTMLGGAGVLDGKLCVPTYNSKNQLVNVERIYGNEKKPLWGGERIGCYGRIGDLPEGGRMILCEGYSTACSLHMATGLPVIIAFNAGNLPAVAKHFKAHDMIICADNDGDGGIGLIKAKEAAKHVSRVRVVVSPVSSDFNDMHVAHGLDAVRNEVMGQPVVVADDFPFKILGRFAGQCYYIPSDGYIYSYAPVSHNKNVLLALANNQWWIDNYGNDKCDAIMVDDAVSALLLASERITFNPAMRRGRGAWIDEGRIIIHQGETILDVATGKVCDVMDFTSKYFYPKAPKVNKSKITSLNDEDANKILSIYKQLPLDNPINAYLLAGWCVVAQISGVMPWRSHVWLTGRAGSGKSWIMDNIVMRLMGSNALQLQSSTTEAGIRQSLQGDAFSVVFDEFEGTDLTSRGRIQRVLELVRQSSSENGGAIAKGTQGGAAKSFIIRSSFCFSSINSGLVQSSDKSRITEIEVDAKKYGSSEQFSKIKRDVVEVFTDNYINAFYWRCVELAPVIRANAAIFSDACANFFGDKRKGDQYGALLAGSLSLTINTVVTPQYAQNWLHGNAELFNKHDEQSDNISDEQKCLDTIMQAQIIHDGRIDRVWQLIEYCCDTYSEENTISRKNSLLSYGLKIERNVLYVANTCENMKKLLRDTPFGENWGKTLKRLENAKPSDGTVRFGGFSTRATAITLDFTT